MMRAIRLALLIAGGAIGAIACGSSASSDGPPTDPNGFGTLDTSGACKTDADCAAGEACRSVRIGEIEQKTCVRQPIVDGGDRPDPSSSKDGATSDAQEPPLPDAGSSDAAPIEGGTTCASALSVTITSKGPTASCATSTYNTTVVSSSPAKLSHPCAGNGPASVTFGTQTFTGSVLSGTITVTNVQTYPFNVVGTGTVCNYTSTQTISGTLASGTLNYSYTEVLAAGQPPICAFLTAACSQSGPVSVTAAPQ